MAQPSFTPRPAPKKGLPVIAWIGIGCVGIAVIGIVGFIALGTFAARKARDLAEEVQANPVKVAAELAVRANPDLELVSSDETAGTITIREKKTGKVATFTYADVQRGRWTFETEDGRVEIDAQQGADGVTVKTDKGEMRFGTSAAAADVPDWVPVHPDATRIEGAFATRTAEQQAGAVSFTVPGDVDGVAEHYRSWMEKNGYEVSSSVMTTPDGRSAVLIGRDRASGRTLTVTSAPEGEATRVAIQYASTGQ